MVQWVKNHLQIGDTGDVCLIPGLGRFPGGRKWQPTLVSLPEKSHGQRSLGAPDHRVAESDMTECLNTLTHTRKRYLAHGMG